MSDEPGTNRPTLIDLNTEPFELNYYAFMVILDKCNESFNVLLPEICVPKEIKGINVKVFNMTENKNETKIMIKHISCDCKCKFNSATFNSNRKQNSKTCQHEYKNYCEC